MYRIISTILLGLITSQISGQNISDENNRFAFNLFHKLANSSENCIFSNHCDFSGNPNKEASGINHWVEERTKGKIKDLVNTGMITKSTRMLLINAIYFYGDWLHAFNKELTCEDIFYLKGDQTVKVKFMNSMHKMKYAADDDFQLLAIPYKKNEASMLVFLPKSKADFESYIQSLTHEKFKSLILKMSEFKIDLSLPKFSLSSQFELGKVLFEMGMKHPFSNHADFSGINGKRELKIDQLIHKAFIEVSEKGTEAAAATVVKIVEIDAVPDEEKMIRFNANHPFIFMILDNATGQILFCGVINHPS